MTDGILLKKKRQELPSGTYELRLVVVDRTGNYWPEFATIEVTVE